VAPIAVNTTSIVAGWLVVVLSLLSRMTSVDGCAVDAEIWRPKFETGVVTHPFTAFVISIVTYPFVPPGVGTFNAIAAPAGGALL
jgi:hypothetical protein